jgi:phage/plasmid-like protein (TIGR03299 family)
MSQETMTWLNENTLIGFTAKRGSAWHYRASDQGDEPNHYEGAIPVEDVRRRLFHWQPVEGDLTSTYVTEDGVTQVSDPTRKTIIRPDTGAVLGVFKQGFRIHEYGQWLVSNVETLLDDQLSIGSAGLLKGGAVAWVQVEMPETITTPEGVAFRPFLSAATSLDGSLASTYQTGSQVIVCDNTLAASLGEKAAARIKVRHSRNSMGKIADVRDALQIVHTIADDFAAEVASLCSIKVTDDAWAKFLDAHLNTAGDKSPRSVALAASAREQLQQLWKHDERVSPWTGTAYGVLAAVNTHAHHLGIVRGTSRVERNQLRAVQGAYDKLDTNTILTLDKVLA